MKYGFILAVIFLSINFCCAQKGIEKITKKKIDSLQRIHVDTILYYISYCGECEITGRKHPCYLKSGYTLADNIIIYQQKGKFYTLDFDCDNVTTKIKLDSCRSIPYFTSIIPVLIERNKTIDSLNKYGKFSSPIVSDGGFENVRLYLNKNIQNISMSNSEEAKSNTFQENNWIDKQLTLLRLIHADLANKK